MLEGLIIGAYAIGAHEGYIYVRQEYPLAVENVGIAIEQAEEYGLLGKNILGSGFDFDVKVHRGAGAFVCGEETALLMSLEGKAGRAEAEAAVSGGQGALGQADQHQQRGDLGQRPADHQQGRRLVRGDRHRGEQGHQDLLAGRQDQQHRPGRSADGHHAPGHHLRDRRRHPRRQEVQGGADRRPVRRLHPRGACSISQVDFDELTKAGSMMGSGGMIVMDEDTCMVDVARYFLDFLADESCGKCVALPRGRAGRCTGSSPDITEGKGKEGDIELLEELAEVDQRGLALRARQERPQPGPEHASLLPGRVRGAHQGEAVPGACPARS